MLQKAPGRKADAPASLPLDDESSETSGQFLNFVSEDKDESSFIDENNEVEDDYINQKSEDEKSEDINNFFGINEDDENKSTSPPNLPIV